jgi:hypothetical protein
MFFLANNEGIGFRDTCIFPHKMAELAAQIRPGDHYLGLADLLPIAERGCRKLGLHSLFGGRDVLRLKKQIQLGEVHIDMSAICYHLAGVRHWSVIQRVE